MRRDLLPILCCPVCRHSLELRVTRETPEEVLEGSLHCARCPQDYPINDGIPDLLPPDER